MFWAALGMMILGAFGTLGVVWRLAMPIGRMEARALEVLGWALIGLFGLGVSGLLFAVAGS